MEVYVKNVCRATAPLQYPEIRLLSAVVGGQVRLCDICSSKREREREGAREGRGGGRGGIYEYILCVWRAWL